MAKTAPVENTGNQTATPQTPTKGARILKYGLLASACTVQVSGPAAIGNYGKFDLPLIIDGQRFILPLSPQSPDFVALSNAFGEPATWQGCHVQVSDGKMLKQVSVRPIADAQGHPVHLK